jgi:general stress protein 26
MADNNGDKARRDESIQKLWSMMKEIKVAMMTTSTKDGTLRSRPMMSQNEEFNGDLWFFTGKSTPKVDEIEARSRVNLAYANPDDNVFVSLSDPADLQVSGLQQEDDDKKNTKESPEQKVGNTLRPNQKISG